MTNLHPMDLDNCLRKLPRQVKDLLTNFTGAFLAGGYIRSIIAGEAVHDVDIFAPTVAIAQAMAKIYATSFDEHLDTFESDNAITIRGGRYKVQIIKRWQFAKAADCLAAFDFTISCACLWAVAGKWESACRDDFYSDLAAKRLTYLSPTRDEEAAGSMMRVMKFLRRGYYIPQKDMGAVIARMVMKAQQTARIQNLFNDMDNLTEERWAERMSKMLCDVYPSSRGAV